MKQESSRYQSRKPYRSDDPGELGRQLNGTLIPALYGGQVHGNTHTFQDYTTRDGYTLTYDAKNRLTAVSGPATASFVYDADGGRVKATFDGTTTIYIGSYYEKTGNAIKKYYYAGDRRVAMRTGGQTYYLFLDHLGGTHITASGTNGAELGKLLYKPWGETRLNTGTTLTTWRLCEAH